MSKTEIYICDICGVESADAVGWFKGVTADICPKCRERIRDKSVKEGAR